jgi:hypothetical protein
MSAWAAQVMDYGYPQFTEAKILSEFIKTDAHRMEVRCGAVIALQALVRTCGAADHPLSLLWRTGAGAAAHGRHKRGVMAQRRPQVSARMAAPCKHSHALLQGMLTNPARAGSRRTRCSWTWWRA